MVCAICYDEITAATGKVELSCSHAFHLSCLSSWFKIQSGKDLEQNCPCCRHMTNEHETISLTDSYELVIKEYYLAKMNEYQEEVQGWYNTIIMRMAENEIQYSLHLKALRKDFDREIAKADKAAVLAQDQANRYREDAILTRENAEKCRQAAAARSVTVKTWEKWTATLRDNKKA